MEITQEMIKSMLKSSEWQNNMLVCQFQADNQQEPLTAYGMVPVDQEKMMKQVMEQAMKQAAISGAANAAGNAVGNMIGGQIGSMAGSSLGSAAAGLGAGQMDMSKLMQVEPNEENTKTALINAFNSVAQFYSWNADTNSFEYKS